MAEKTELKAGTQLQNGKYTLEKKIGSGGFGITYKGVWKIEVPTPLGATTVDYHVAVKEFFFEEYCSRDIETGRVLVNSEKGQELFDKFKEKLKKEAAILLKLEHPNIVNVSEVFEENNTAYMVMEYIDGRNLKDLIGKESQYKLDDALKIIKQVGNALHYIHSHNIIHLDVKPANILIDEAGNAKLIDFGIAKQYTDGNPETQAATVATFSKGYSPIEQYAVNRKEKYGAHTDVYALGATCYHCLTGEVPIESATRLEEELVPPSRLNPQIPIHVEWAIQKAMELKYKDRFASVAEFIEALDSQQIDWSGTTQVTREGKTILQNGLEELDTLYVVAPKATSVSTSEKKTVISKVNQKKNKGEKSEILNADSQECRQEEQKQEKRKLKPVLVWSVSIAVVAILAIWAALYLIPVHLPAASNNPVQPVVTPAQPDKEAAPVVTQPKEDQTPITPEPEPSVTQPAVENKPSQQMPVAEQPKTQEKTNTQPVAPSNTVSPSAGATTAVSTKTISIQGHTYTGGVKNGKPEGKGKIIYSGNDRVSPDDVKKNMAAPGDYLEGYWHDGLLEKGILYDRSGTKKATIIIGRY